MAKDDHSNGFINIELIRYLLNQRENKIWLENSNIIMQHDPKRLPYVHPVLDSAKNGGYVVNVTTHEIGEGFEIVDYAYTKNGSAHLDLLVSVIAETMAFNDNFDAWGNNPKKPLDDKINQFLGSHFKVDYNEFMKGIDYKEILGDGFDELGKNNLKKQLFDYRAKAYLLTIATAEKKSHDIKSSLDALTNTKIYPIKNKESETVLEILRKKLQVA